MPANATFRLADLHVLRAGRSSAAKSSHVAATLALSPLAKGKLDPLWMGKIHSGSCQVVLASKRQTGGNIRVGPGGLVGAQARSKVADLTQN